MWTKPTKCWLNSFGRSASKRHPAFSTLKEQGNQMLTVAKLLAFAGASLGFACTAYLILALGGVG
jgi:hypothetical protein